MKDIKKIITDFATVASFDALISILEGEIDNYKYAEYGEEEYKNNIMLSCYLVLMKVMMEKGYIKEGDIKEGDISEFLKEFND